MIILDVERSAVVIKYIGESFSAWCATFALIRLNTCSVLLEEACCLLRGTVLVNSSL